MTMNDPTAANSRSGRAQLDLLRSASRSAASSRTVRCSSMDMRDHAATSESKRPQPMQVFDASSLHTPTQGDSEAALLEFADCDIRALVIRNHRS